ncbi:hypothetical protein [Pararhodospirillum oryzae]|uniref:Uncharacterized protein n=1 Tax=Pararhodospirillum oryzae TaxID=478448 RepID=A0A512H745_9PROT|nr:hypothetical protein [Pararhodospirillum oryzae]GEO81267.1 hypothetical protein ROR02_13980 [Pararhodospirillum oryzae]
MSSSVDPRTAVAVARAGLERQGRPATPRPGDQACQRCGAAFQWERASSGGGWVMRLVKASERCDCGYGRRGGPRPDGD